MDDRAAAFTRVPPHSMEAEESIVGGALIDSEALDRIADQLTPDHFYVERHGLIFKAMLALVEQGRPVDVITISDRMTQSGELAKIGGLAYLAELSDRVATAANIEHYVKIVREKAVLRQLIRASGGILEEAYDSRGPVEDFVDRAEQAIFDVSGDTLRATLSRIDSLIPSTIQRIEQLYERKEEVTGVPSGFVDLDKMTAGFQPSDLIIVAGRPSMGKTAFCLNIAEYASMERGIGVAIFSMEMSKEQLVMRMLCSQAELDNSRVRTGHLGERDFTKLALTAGDLGKAPIFIDDAPAQTVLEVRAKARRLKNDPSADLGMIVVDYLQLMRGAGEDSREQEISSISRALKALAKELDLPVVALSQLNRQVESRTDKRPGMADLRESGAIEQDADIIAFIYRDEVYNKDESPDAGIAEIIVGKQRNGPTGTARLGFENQFARFRNLSFREDDGGGGFESDGGSVF